MQRNKQDKDRGLIQIDVVEKSMRPSRLPSVGRKSEQNRGDSQAATSTLRPIFSKKGIGRYFHQTGDSKEEAAAAGNLIYVAKVFFRAHEALADPGI